MIIILDNDLKPITVAGPYKAWTVFAGYNIGIVGSNLTRGMEVCVRLFWVCVVLWVGSGLATGWSPVQAILPSVYRIKKLKQRRRGRIDPRFLDLDTSYRWMISFTPLPLYPRRKSTRYPLDRRLSEPKCKSGRHGEVKIFAPTGTQTSTPRSSSL
jgi:hypothetical protein